MANLVNEQAQWSKLNGDWKQAGQLYIQGR